jgi:hypothetical protein
MSSSFLVRTIDVEVDTSTWLRRPVPPQLKTASGKTTIDIGRALHMLGTLTMPSILSSASPALFWAWLRYYLAPTLSSDLRITIDFSDLDPHQKGILSDDFGVALATQWMLDRLGPFTHIVDGRRFANQFTHLLRKRHKAKAKVGTSKAPDFVMRDIAGKWHVLECKGTQASREYQRRVLKTAIAQKHAIQLIGSIKGEQLASSLYIAHEKDKSASHMKVIDPDEDDPLIILTGQLAGEMEANANRLAVAQALGCIGLSEIAVDMSLPTDVDLESELLLPSELARLRLPRDTRVARATEQARTRNLDTFTQHHRRYEGRVVELDLPPTGVQLPYRKVRIRQGVTTNLIEELLSADSLLDQRYDDHVRPCMASAQVLVEAAHNRTVLTYGDVLYSEVDWI